MNPVRGLARDRVASPQDLSGATSNGMKKLLKSCYRSALNFKRRARNRIFPTSFILLYHKIGGTGDDPLKLAVGPGNFRDQLIFLKRNYNILPLSQLILRIREGQLTNNLMAITFDDGYADNFYNALPILKEFGVPATIFVSSGYIGFQKPFYWETNVASRDNGKPLSENELVELAKCNLIEIGAHTVTHPRLSALPPDHQQKEIENSKKQLGEILGHFPSGFAYPFGDKESFDKNTTKMVEAANFDYACSNIHERITGKSSIYALPRFIVRDWTAEELKEEMKKWI